MTELTDVRIDRPPRLPARLAARPAIMRQLDRMAPVTVVRALGGHGKTTLVAVWAQALSDTHVIWIRVSSTSTCASLRAQLNASRPAAAVARTLIVIDEAHLIDDPVVFEELAEQVANDPDLHLVVCGHSGDVALAAARRHHLETNVVTGRDLTITPAEIPAFADAWGHVASAERATQLYEAVGGWLLPLRMVLDASPSDSSILATDVARDHLEHTVIPGVIGDDRLLLAMRLSLVPTLDEKLAAVLLETGPGPDAADVLANFRQAGLLERVRQESGGPRWHFPTLIRHVLLDRLEAEHPDVARSRTTTTRAITRWATSSP